MPWAKACHADRDGAGDPIAPRYRRMSSLSDGGHLHIPASNNRQGSLLLNRAKDGIESFLTEALHRNGIQPRDYHAWRQARLRSRALWHHFADVSAVRNHRIPEAKDDRPLRDKRRLCWCFAGPAHQQTLLQRIGSLDFGEIVVAPVSHLIVDDLPVAHHYREGLEPYIPAEPITAVYAAAGPPAPLLA